MKRAKTKELTECEPTDLAQWMGLADASLLGPEPLRLPAATVERLKLYGARVELSSAEAAVILRVSRETILNYCRPEPDAGRPALGYRQTMPSAPRRIVAGELAAWIAQTRTPPVPTTGISTRADDTAARKAEAEARARHKLPRRAKARA